MQSIKTHLKAAKQHFDAYLRLSLVQANSMNTPEGRITIDQSLHNLHDALHLIPKQASWLERKFGILGVAQRCAAWLEQIDIQAIMLSTSKTESRRRFWVQWQYRAWIRRLQYRQCLAWNIQHPSVPLSLFVAFPALILWGIWFYWTPQPIEAKLLVHTQEGYRHQHTLTLLDNGQPHDLRVFFKKEISLQSLSLQLPIRTERFFTIESIRTLSYQQEQRQSIPFGGLELKRWNLWNMSPAGTFEITQEGIEALRGWDITQESFQQIAHNAGIANPESIAFSKELLTRLEAEVDQSFSSKRALTQWLKSLEFSLDKRHQKLIRMAFKQPSFQAKPNTKPLMQSPSLNLNHIYGLQLRITAEQNVWQTP